MQTSQAQFIDNLKQSLAASLNPDQAIRRQAEQFLIEAQSRPDYCSALLEVSADNTIDHNLSLSAAVQLGQLVDVHWKFHSAEQADKITVTGFNFIILSEEDKTYVRTNIIAKMFQCQNRLVTKQYIRCIIMICRFDYPLKWPSLLSDISNALTSGNDKGVLTGCVALFCLAKKYEYEMDEAREPLFEVMQQCSGTLGSICEQYMGQLDNETSLTILHQIVKVFYTANQLFLSPHLKVEGGLTPWIQMFKILLDMPVPEHLESATDDIDTIASRDKHIIWKVKAQAARLTFRLFSRYANLKFILKKTDPDRPFQEYFNSNYAETLCESHLQIIFKRKTHFVGSKALNFVIKLVSSAIKIPLTMEKMKPFIDNILYETAIPLMIISNRDIQLFEEDPIEYVRKQQDLFESIYMPKVTTVELLQLICQYKSTPGRKVKPDYLMPFLAFVSNNMQQYGEALAAGGNPDWRVKESLLYAVGSLNEDIALYKEYAHNIEPMLKTHVLSDFASPHPLLKSRACWVYGQFSDYEFNDKQHIQQAVDGIYQSLFSEHLPVKFAAAISLSKMLDDDTAMEFLKPALKNILEVYLKIMEEIDSEDLISALEMIMERFQDDIGPFASQLAQQLTNKYQQLIQEDDEDDGLEERLLAAAGCVTAIRRILEAISKDKPAMAAILPIIYPILMHSLTTDGLDAIDDGLDCINVFVYYGCDKQIGVPVQLWKLLPQMLFMVAGDANDVDGGFAIEQLSQVAICVQNFIARDPQTLMTVGEGQTESYFDLTLKFIQRVLVISSNSEHK